MQVAKIGAINSARQKIFNPERKNVYFAHNTRDTFEKSKAISFGANMKDVIKYSVDWGYDELAMPTVAEFDVYYPKQKKLNILKGDEDHLTDVAESLCMYSDEDILNFTKIYYPFHFDVNQAKSEKAYSIIMPYIFQQRTKLVNLNELKEKLDAKREEKGLCREEELGFEYIVGEIERMDKKCSLAKSEYLKAVHREFYEDDDPPEYFD